MNIETQPLTLEQMAYIAINSEKVILPVNDPAFLFNNDTCCCYSRAIVIKNSFFDDVDDVFEVAKDKIVKHIHEGHDEKIIFVHSHKHNTSGEDTVYVIRYAVGDL